MRRMLTFVFVAAFTAAAATAWLDEVDPEAPKPVNAEWDADALAAQQGLMAPPEAPPEAPDAPEPGQ